MSGQSPENNCVCERLGVQARLLRCFDELRATCSWPWLHKHARPWVAHRPGQLLRSFHPLCTRRIEGQHAARALQWTQDCKLTKQISATRCADCSATSGAGGAHRPQPAAGLQGMGDQGMGDEVSAARSEPHDHCRGTRLYSPGKLRRSSSYSARRQRCLSRDRLRARMPRGHVGRSRRAPLSMLTGTMRHDMRSADAQLEAGVTEGTHRWHAVTHTNRANSLTAAMKGSASLRVRSLICTVSPFWQESC